MYEPPYFPQKIPITDDMMFSYAMRKPEICAAVIECLIPGIHIAKIQFRDRPEDFAPQTQHTIQGELGTHSVRLDVYLDDGKRVFNVEMQTVRQSSLAKRARYYSSRIDCEILQPAVDYDALRPTYVIFICTFDPFGDGLYHYSFENTCLENPGRRLNDQSYKLFFNTTGTKGEITPELKELLKYFDAPEETDVDQSTKLVRRLDEVVETANHDQEWRRIYMTWAQKMYDVKRQAREEGEKRGEARGEKRGIAIGEKRGIEIGEKRGEERGEKRGIAIGEKRGEALFTRLSQLLLAQNRFEDLKAAIENPQIRERFYLEFGLK